MVDITPLIAADRQVIQSYAAGRFKISGVTHEGPVIVLPGRTLAWTPRDPLIPDDFAALATLPAAEKIDVLLLGSGPRALPPLPALRAALRDHGIALEVMDTGAACRTYNVLLADGRRVAAALLPL